jgi:uncharacterized protein (DUF433 family)/DNA-binding transcriptional MerR regulator
METPSLLGKGLYSLPEAARLLGVPTAKLRRWANGYIFQHRGKERYSTPVVHRELSGTHNERLLTFADLIELKFVSMFREKGVSMITIRAAAKAASERFGTGHPFAVKRFDTDGKRIFATLEDMRVKGISDERLIEELAISQTVMEEVAKPFFLKLEYDSDEVSRLRPLGKGTRIVLDPHRTFGKPIDEQSGVPTFVLYQMFKGGESSERIAWWYDIDVEAVSAAIEYESSLQKAA